MEQNPLLSAIEHHRAGRLEEAEGIYREILARNPEDADALNLLGVIARQKGDLPAAIDLIARAVRLKPEFADAHGNLASVLKDAGQLDAALDTYRRAIQLKPDFAEAHYGLGHALLKKGELNAAINSYRRVIELRPEFADAYNNLGIALKGLGRSDEAISSYRQAIQLNPNGAEGYYNLGNALRGMSQLDEAAEAYQRAIEIKSDYAEAHNNLGLVLAEQGRLDEAIAHCRLAIKLKPKGWDGYINLLYALYHHPAIDSRQLLKESRQWARRQVVELPIFVPQIENSRGRRLRVGYLSPFFGLCADAHFIYPLLAHHDRTQFETFCYSRAREDELSGRMRKLCDHWLDIRQLGTRAAAELIRGHGIDMLAVMSRPADECQSVMAYRMAPIQITWLTFASSTTGLETVDYRISDPFLDPPGIDERCYAEKTVRLPETAWCFDPLDDVSTVKPPPALGNGYITFGSLHRLSKMNPLVVATWAKVLQAVPNSRIHILSNRGSYRARLLDQFQIGGIERGRIEFIDRQSRAHYLEQYHRIDITLDTFPFGGHTTALDSLWMGIPVVTLAGQTSVGRAASSALHNLGLSQLVARTPEEFVSIAAGLASDLKTLAELRGVLRQAMQASSLTDGPRFARNMEHIYRQLWQELPKL